MPEEEVLLLEWVRRVQGSLAREHVAMTGAAWDKRGSVGRW